MISRNKLSNMFEKFKEKLCNISKIINYIKNPMIKHMD